MNTKIDGPRAAQRESRPDVDTAAKATDTASLRRTSAGRRRKAGRQRETALTCRVSLLVPSGRRTRWWYLASCPACGSPHLGRARDLPDVTGTRRLPCGHYVVITIARTYGRTEAAA